MNHKIEAVSLIEVVCVVAILAMITAAATLGFQGVQRFRAERQLHNIAGELSDLRMESLAKRTHTELLFSDSGYRCIVNGKRGEEIPYEPALDYLNAATAKGETSLGFNAAGRPSNSGRIYFKIGERRLDLILSPVNARIRIEKNEVR